MTALTQEPAGQMARNWPPDPPVVFVSVYLPSKKHVVASAAKEGEKGSGTYRGSACGLGVMAVCGHQTEVPPLVDNILHALHASADANH